jgi:hypothetical protein
MIPSAPTPPPPDPAAMTPADLAPELDGQVAPETPFADQLSDGLPAVSDASDVGFFESLNVQNDLSSTFKECLEEAQNPDLSSKEQRELTWKMFGLQLSAQEHAMQIEMVTKLVEHGTSSVKQISQTQT